MSRETHLFIDTRNDRSSLEGAIRTILGTVFTESDASQVLPPPVAQAKLPGLFLELGHHDFENDRDMAFAGYAFDLAIVPVGSDTRASRHDVDIGRRVLRGLAGDEGIRRLLLVDDLQTELERYEDAR